MPGASPTGSSLTRGCGVPGERWRKHPWLTLPDGSPDPRIQVSILPTRVCDLVWRDRTGTPHPGDTIVADLDMSEANLPTGSLLQAGTAVLRVSDVFNDGCVKWKVRYGRAAKDWIVAEGHPPLRLRGVLCSIEQSGVVRLFGPAAQALAGRPQRRKAGVPDEASGRTPPCRSAPCESCGRTGAVVFSDIAFQGVWWRSPGRFPRRGRRRSPSSRPGGGSAVAASCPEAVSL